MQIERRKFLKKSIYSVGAMIVAPNVISCSGSGHAQKEAQSVRDFEQKHFEQGVASFDPTSEGVIIWTRYSYEKETAIIWEVALDERFETILRSGEIMPEKASDYTIAIELQGLEPGLQLFYRFIDNQEKGISSVGETITLPEDPSKVTFAVCSCSNFQAGLFNTYHAIANDQVDIVLHLGDYIYEYAVGEYGTNAHTVPLGRLHNPANEVVDLAGYRARYKQYRSDKHLKLAHQKKPFMCVWDDHEIANNTYLEGAQNHNDGEGHFQKRLADAVQAYSEYIPVRTQFEAKDIIYRNIKIGSLVNLLMLDTRVIGRDEQVSLKDYHQANGAFDHDALNSALWDASRSTLGYDQKKWLKDELDKSDAVWQVFGQQALMGTMEYPLEFLPVLSRIVADAPTGYAGTSDTTAISEYRSKLKELAKLKERFLQQDPTLTEEEKRKITKPVPYNMDAWDGYMAEREEVLGLLKGEKFVCLAGDTHNAWSSDIYNKKGNLVGFELATTSINGPGLEGYLGTEDGTDMIKEVENHITSLVDNLRYFDGSKRGFLKVTFDKDSCTAQWMFINTIWSEEYECKLGNTRTLTAKDFTT